MMPLYLLLLTLLLDSGAADCSTGLSVVAPELAIPGKTTAVLVTLHGPVGIKPLNVSVKLFPDCKKGIKSDDELLPSQYTVETVHEIKGHGILSVQIPQDVTGNYLLQTTVNATGKCTLQSSSEIRLVGPVKDVIIRPAKHNYQPGEFISFWVLALDHDLQIVKDIIGSVSIKNPDGTKVAVWDEVSLDEGVKAFTLPLSPYANAGKWLLHVEVDSNEFYTAIEVAPGLGAGYPDIAAAEEHYVELSFGKEMRRRYKPGLPFAGKVEAMSTEKSVRVRVKVYDNTTSIYSQDIEITAGEGTFIVPAILADSDIIILQAELVSVESKEIENHYVLAREKIHKWNSTSECYLLIEGVENTLQPDEQTPVTILSTCPCKEDFHYVITTGGRITDWAQKRYEDPIGANILNGSDGTVCKLNFSFTVKSIMAPVSQLLVYYITPEGEPISDVISFDVKLLYKQIYVNIEEREYWLPNQPLDLEVVTEQNSMVCLLGGRAVTNSDIRFDPRISKQHEINTITGELDFLEAGVSFFQRKCIQKKDSEVSAVFYKQRGSGAGPAKRRRPAESLIGGVPFDQLWLWKCFNYTSVSTAVSTLAPQEVGKWTLWALTVSSSGLKFSAPVTIRVFRPLQVEFHLPSSLKVRETLEVDVKIGNNINSCMDVTALLALSEGAQFLSNGLLYVTERLRLGPHGATSLVVRILVITPGLKNLTVEVNGYTSSSCEGNGKYVTNTSLAGAVIHSATVNVESEGVVKTDTDSAYFCANEYLFASTTHNCGFDWVTASRNKNGLILELKSSGQSTNRQVVVALVETRYYLDKMYKIVIGDDDNTVTWIGRGNLAYNIRLATAQTPSILSNDEWRTFWITWDKHIITFGYGSVPNKNSFLKWRMDRKIKIRQVGFTSMGGSGTEFRISNFNEEGGFSQVLHMDTPKSVVPGSESGNLLVVGGMGLNQLITKHNNGLGGLSKALVAVTPLLILHHFERNNVSLKENFLRELPLHIQTILSYRKMDNSFSEHPMFSSLKSTIIVLQVLKKTQSYFNVDPELIRNIKRWIQLRQDISGSFNPSQADVQLCSHLIRTTSLQRNMELTAETLITLHEIGFETSEDTTTIQKAKVYLEENVDLMNKSDVIMAVVTLALVLMKSENAERMLINLKYAITTDDNEFGWRHLVPKKDAAGWLYETENESNINEPNIPVTMEEYKASIYALMTLCTVGDLRLAESAARYLFFHSHILNNYPTLIYPTVKALSQYHSMLNNHHRGLTISLATSGMELTDTLELKTEQRPHVLRLPSLPTKIFVYATGEGCATIQGSTTYSTYSTQSITTLLEISSNIIEEILPDHSSVEEIEGKLPVIKIKTCFKWKGGEPSGILRMEVTLFSGFELNSIAPLLLYPEVNNMIEMMHGVYNNHLWFIFANVISNCTVCVQYSIKSGYVITSIRPAYAKIYPISREDLAADIFFHTQIGSNLLKDITEDDLFTWFRHNGSGSASLLKREGQKYLLNSNNNNIRENTNSTPETTPTITNPTIKNVDKNTISPILLDQPNTLKKQYTTLKHLKVEKEVVTGQPYPLLVNQNKDNDENILTGSFVPETKNDRYLLLDKEQLWGILKEAVNNAHINKRTTRS